MQKYLAVKSLYTIGLETREVENCWVFDQDLHIFHSTMLLMQFVQSLCLVLVKPSTLVTALAVLLSVWFVNDRLDVHKIKNIKGLTSQHITTPTSHEGSPGLFLASLASELNSVHSFLFHAGEAGQACHDLPRISSGSHLESSIEGRIYWSCWTTPSASSTWRWDPSLFDFFATSSAVIPREFFCSFLAPRAKMATTNRGFPSCTAKWRG